MAHGKNGVEISLPVLIALCVSLLERGLKGGLVLFCALSLGGPSDPFTYAVAIVQLGIEKGAAILLMSVSARTQLFDLSDETGTKINIQFYSEARDALSKRIPVCK
jgi:ATP-dependent Lon protease